MKLLLVTACIIYCIIIIDGLDFDELVKENNLLWNNGGMIRARDRKFYSDDLLIFVLWSWRRIIL